VWVKRRRDNGGSECRIEREGDEELEVGWRE